MGCGAGTAKRLDCAIYAARAPLLSPEHLESDDQSALSHCECSRHAHVSHLTRRLTDTLKSSYSHDNAMQRSSLQAGMLLNLLRLCQLRLRRLLVLQRLLAVPTAGALALALDARPQAALAAEDELQRHERPALVARQHVVELGRGGAQRRQARPGNRGKVVVLVVVADLCEVSAFLHEVPCMWQLTLYASALSGP